MERQEEQMGKCESESNSPTLLDTESVHQADWKMVHWHSNPEKYYYMVIWHQYSIRDGKVELRKYIW